MPLFSFAEYVEGDGTLDFVCKDTNIEAAPYNIFETTLLFDNGSGKSGFDLISDTNLASGNGDIVYKIEVRQHASAFSEEMSFPQPLKGCELAPVTISAKESIYEIYFECAADGDRGHGSIKLDAESGQLQGVFSFPEGQQSLRYPIVEDSTFELSCTFK